MSRFVGRTYPEEKVAYAARMNDLLSKYSRILVVEADNVLSGQMHDVRLALRGRAEIIMGKNTLMRKVIKMRLENNETPANEALYDAFCSPSGSILVGNVGLVLTNEPVDDILAILARFKVKANARVGAVAPIEVIVPAGKTGLEPTQTHFFMALNIATKIEGGQVTIVKDVVVCRPGEKVGSSEAKLLLKMKIKPFEYGLETKFLYDDGIVYPRSILGLTDSAIGSFAQQAVDDVAALSLATGIQTTPSLSHEVVGAFKDILALALATDVSFDDFGAASFLDAIKSGKVAAAPAAAAAAPAAGGGGGAAAAPAAAKAAAPAEEEETADFGMDLF